MLQFASHIVRPWLPRALDDLLSPMGYTTTPMDGVTCTMPTPSHDFKVELKVLENNRTKELANAALCAIAYASGSPRGIVVEWTSSVCACGKETIVTAFIRIPTREASGPWLGNTLHNALTSRFLDPKPLTCIDVVPVMARGNLVQRHVAVVQSVWCNNDAEHQVDGKAWRMTWRPAMQVAETDWVDVNDDPSYDWAAPVMVRGLGPIREMRAKEKAKADSTEKTTAKAAGDKDTGLTAAAAAEVKRRRAAAAAMAAGCEKAKEEAWLAAVERLPLGKFSPPATLPKRDALSKARAALDAGTHGMADAKDVVLQIAGQLIHAPGSRMRALGLQGPPGCGKTSFATRAIPQALGRPARVINLGGAKDSSVLLGHDFTYTGSRPGKIATAVSEMGVCDPILVFDELDKVSDTAGGREIIHVLMSLIDPVQNAAFSDTYLAGIPIDLSRALCVFTFNDTAAVDPILLDRMRVVHVPDATKAEKAEIMTRHMLPRVAESCGLSCAGVAPDALELLMTCSGSGMRGIEKVLEGALLRANLRAIGDERPPADTTIGRVDVEEAAAPDLRLEGAGRAAMMTMYC